MPGNPSSTAKKPIQPFVPVSPGERTKLYPHQELCALTRSDPRNELDEMSEPQRFTKDVTKPLAASEHSSRGLSSGGLVLTFLTGAAVGAVLVALTTPKTGPELRGDLKDLAQRAQQKAGFLAEEAGEAWDDLNERVVLAAADFE